MTQLSIDFSRQNNAENQAILDRNKDRFTGQCHLVYSLLLSGKRLTTATALAYGIGDLRARIRDLKKAGVPVQKKLIEGRYKEYYL